MSTENKFLLFIILPSLLICSLSGFYLGHNAGYKAREERLQRSPIEFTKNGHPAVYVTSNQNELVKIWILDSTLVDLKYTNRYFQPINLNWETLP